MAYKRGEQNVKNSGFTKPFFIFSWTWDYLLHIFHLLLRDNIIWAVAGFMAHSLLPYIAPWWNFGG